MKWLNTLISAGRHNKIKLAEYSDKGGRENNQDAYAHFKTEQGILLVIADGLGGHESGELASHYFCQHLIEQAKLHSNQLKEAPTDTLEQIIHTAADKMRDEIKQHDTKIDAHTTCAIAWINNKDHSITTAHIGDSRIYIFNHNEILWRSRDHSVVQMLVDMGEVDKIDMGQHPEQGQLTRTIGMSGDIRPTIKSHQKLERGQAILLCSDGFWEQISEKEIQLLVNSKLLQKSVEALVKQAVKRGGVDGDNVTAQVFM